MQEEPRPGNHADVNRFIPARGILAVSGLKLDGLTSRKRRTDAAFPNAYISTDEPPRRSLFGRALGAFAAVGVGYLGLVILALSVATAEYSPVSQFASDYGVGAYGAEMNSGFLLAGLGVFSLALVLAFSQRRRVVRVGGALLAPSGAALVAAGLYRADIEGAAATFHGLAHDVAGAAFFLVTPVALLLIARGFGRTWFRLTLSSLAVAVAAVVANGALGLGATGLAERAVILVVFTSIILTAARVYRES